MSAAPSFARSSTPIPVLSPLGQFSILDLSLSIERRMGQPAEMFVFTLDRAKPDDAYIRKVTNALGIDGPGVLGDAPDALGAWRLWLGSRTLAVNAATGDVLFFDPRADDGPRPPGPAQRDPVGFLDQIVRPLVPAADPDLTPRQGRVSWFRGLESATFSAEPQIGSWLGSGDRDAALLFPTYQPLFDADLPNGATIYDTDEFGLFTSKGRPVQLVHRPLRGFSSAVLYGITAYGEAVDELRADPKRHLHVLSAKPGEALTLSVAADDVQAGYAWASAMPGDLTRLRQTLVPVWAFFAHGTSSSGAPASALFLVDAVRPEFRAPALGRTTNVTADLLLRDQLSVSVGGHTPLKMDPLSVAQEYVGCPGARVELSRADDVATAHATCGNGASVSLTLRRAFPGLANSIWYVASSAK